MEECTQVLLSESHNDLISINEKLPVATLEVEGVYHTIYNSDNTIGRDDTCNITIKNNTISSKHAVIEADDPNSHLIYDVGSTNKTRLGKLTLKPHVRYVIRDGEPITFGNITALYNVSRQYPTTPEKKKSQSLAESPEKNGSQADIILESSQEENKGDESVLDKSDMDMFDEKELRDALAVQQNVVGNSAQVTVKSADDDIYNLDTMDFEADDIFENIQKPINGSTVSTDKEPTTSNDVNDLDNNRLCDSQSDFEKSVNEICSQVESEKKNILLNECDSTVGPSSSSKLNAEVTSSVDDDRSNEEVASHDVSVYDLNTQAPLENKADDKKDLLIDKVRHKDKRDVWEDFPEIASPVGIDTSNADELDLVEPTKSGETVKLPNENDFMPASQNIDMFESFDKTLNSSVNKTDKFSESGEDAMCNIATQPFLGRGNIADDTSDFLVAGTQPTGDDLLTDQVNITSTKVDETLSSTISETEIQSAISETLQTVNTTENDFSSPVKDINSSALEKTSDSVLTDDIFEAETQSVLVEGSNKNKSDLNKSRGFHEAATQPYPLSQPLPKSTTSCDSKNIPEKVMSKDSFLNDENKNDEYNSNHNLETPDTNNFHELATQPATIVNDDSKSTEEECEVNPSDHLNIVSLNPPANKSTVNDEFENNDMFSELATQPVNKDIGTEESKTNDLEYSQRFYELSTQPVELNKDSNLNQMSMSSEQTTMIDEVTESHNDPNQSDLILNTNNISTPASRTNELENSLRFYELSTQPVEVNKDLKLDQVQSSNEQINENNDKIAECLNSSKKGGEIIENNPNITTHDLKTSELLEYSQAFYEFSTQPVEVNKDLKLNQISTCSEKITLNVNNDEKNESLNISNKSGDLVENNPTITTQCLKTNELEHSQMFYELSTQPLEGDKDGRSVGDEQLNVNTINVKVTKGSDVINKSGGSVTNSNIHISKPVELEYPERFYELSTQPVPVNKDSNPEEVSRSSMQITDNNQTIESNVDEVNKGGAHTQNSNSTIRELEYSDSFYQLSTQPVEVHKDSNPEEVSKSSVQITGNNQTIESNVDEVNKVGSHTQNSKSTIRELEYTDSFYELSTQPVEVNKNSNLEKVSETSKEITDNNESTKNNIDQVNEGGVNVQSSKSNIRELEYTDSFYELATQPPQGTANNKLESNVTKTKNLNLQNITDGMSPTAGSSDFEHSQMFYELATQPSTDKETENVTEDADVQDNKNTLGNDDLKEVQKDLLGSDKSKGVDLEYSESFYQLATQAPGRSNDTETALCDKVASDHINRANVDDLEYSESFYQLSTQKPVDDNVPVPDGNQLNDMNIDITQDTINCIDKTNFDKHLENLHELATQPVADIDALDVANEPVNSGKIKETNQLIITTGIDKNVDISTCQTPAILGDNSKPYMAKVDSDHSESFANLNTQPAVFADSQTNELTSQTDSYDPRKTIQGKETDLKNEGFPCNSNCDLAESLHGNSNLKETEDNIDLIFSKADTKQFSLVLGTDNSDGAKHETASNRLKVPEIDLDIHSATSVYSNATIEIHPKLNSKPGDYRELTMELSESVCGANLNNTKATNKVLDGVNQTVQDSVDMSMSCLNMHEVLTQDSDVCQDRSDFIRKHENPPNPEAILSIEEESGSKKSLEEGCGEDKKIHKETESESILKNIEASINMFGIGSENNDSEVDKCEDEKAVEVLQKAENEKNILNDCSQEFSPVLRVSKMTKKFNIGDDSDNSSQELNIKFKKKGVNVFPPDTQELNESENNSQSSSSEPSLPENNSVLKKSHRIQNAVGIFTEKNNATSSTQGLSLISGSPTSKEDNEPSSEEPIFKFKTKGCNVFPPDSEQFDNNSANNLSNEISNKIEPQSGDEIKHNSPNAESHIDLKQNSPKEKIIGIKRSSSDKTESESSSSNSNRTSPRGKAVRNVFDSDNVSSSNSIKGNENISACNNESIEKGASVKKQKSNKRDHSYISRGNITQHPQEIHEELDDQLKLTVGDETVAKFQKACNVYDSENVKSDNRTKKKDVSSQDVSPSKKGSAEKKIKLNERDHSYISRGNITLHSQEVLEELEEELRLTAGAMSPTQLSVASESEEEKETEETITPVVRRSSRRRKEDKIAYKPLVETSNKELDIVVPKKKKKTDINKESLDSNIQANVNTPSTSKIEVSKKNSSEKEKRPISESGDTTSTRSVKKFKKVTPTKNEVKESNESLQKNVSSRAKKKDSQESNDSQSSIRLLDCSESEELGRGKRKRIRPSYDGFILDEDLRKPRKKSNSSSVSINDSEEIKEIIHETKLKSPSNTTYTQDRQLTQTHAVVVLHDINKMKNKSFTLDASFNVGDKQSIDNIDDDLIIPTSTVYLNKNTKAKSKNTANVSNKKEKTRSLEDSASKKQGCSFSSKFDELFNFDTPKDTEEKPKLGNNKKNEENKKSHTKTIKNSPTQNKSLNKNSANPSSKSSISDNTGGKMKQPTRSNSDKCDSISPRNAKSETNEILATDRRNSRSKSSAAKKKLFKSDDTSEQETLSTQKQDSRKKSVDNKNNKPGARDSDQLKNSVVRDSGKSKKSGTSNLDQIKSVEPIKSSKTKKSEVKEPDQVNNSEVRRLTRSKKPEVKPKGQNKTSAVSTSHKTDNSQDSGSTQPENSQTVRSSKSKKPIVSKEVNRSAPGTRRRAHSKTNDEESGEPVEKKIRGKKTDKVAEVTNPSHSDCQTDMHIMSQEFSFHESNRGKKPVAKEEFTQPLTKVRRSARSSKNSESNPLHRKIQKVMFTGFSDKKMSSIVTKLGGDIVESPYTCTVLVTDRIRRTAKFLSALACGLPIVTTQWLHSSEKAGSFVDVENFIISDKTAEKQFSFSMKESLQKARTTKLLNGCSVFITHSVKPSLEEIKSLIECSGGKLLIKEPARWPANSFVISCENDKVQWKNISRKGKTPPIVGIEALFSGILKQDLDLEAHRLA